RDGNGLGETSIATERDRGGESRCRETRSGSRGFGEFSGRRSGGLWRQGTAVALNWHWQLQDLAFNGVGHELCFVMDIKLPHEIELVSFDSFNAHSQHLCHAPHGVALSQ